MSYYPIFLDISRRRCVVVGGGNVAERKVHRLLACGARVEVVGRCLSQGLALLKQDGQIFHIDSDYEKGMIEGAYLVIGATDSDAVNERICRDARGLGMPVNIVDDLHLCDFILPSIVERGDLAIAVSTGGRSPALARRIRIELEGLYGPEYATLLEILGRLREGVIAEGRSQKENRERFEALVASDILGMIRDERWGEVKALVLKLTGVEMEVLPT